MGVVQTINVTARPRPADPAAQTVTQIDDDELLQLAGTRMHSFPRVPGPCDMGREGASPLSLGVAPVVGSWFAEHEAASWEERLDLISLGHRAAGDPPRDLDQGPGLGKLNLTIDVTAECHDEAPPVYNPAFNTIY